MKEIKTPESFISYCESLEMTDIPDAYAQLNDDLKENSTLQDFVLEKNGLSFQYFDDNYKRDAEFILNKIGLSSSAAIMLKFIDESLIGDDELLEAACNVSISAHKWLDHDKWNKDAEWYKKIAGYNYGTIHFMPVEVKNSEEMCKAFLDIDIRSYNAFSDEMKANTTVQEYALKKDGYVFHIFPDQFKCDKNYIKKMLADCLDKSDARSYMIFAVCDELQNDQELINLAIERNRFVFEEMFSEKNRNKELFVQYIKVNPQLHMYVSDSLKNDREIIKSMISGGYNEATRKKYFEESPYYDDLEFAREVIGESDYFGTYTMLKPEFKSDEEILSIFSSKFQDARHIGVIAKEALTEEIAEKYIQKDFNAICHIKNEEITRKYFQQFKDKILQKTRIDPKFYKGMTGYLSYMPEVFKAFMKYPLITALDLDQVNYYIRTNKELNANRESLLNHLSKPFFKGIHKPAKKHASSIGIANSIIRMEYIQSLNNGDQNLLTILLSDQYVWVREEAAKKISLSEQEVSDILEKGAKVIVEDNSDLKIDIKHDRYILKGLTENPNISQNTKSRIDNALTNKNKYPEQLELPELPKNIITKSVLNELLQIKNPKEVSSYIENFLVNGEVEYIIAVKKELKESMKSDGYIKGVYGFTLLRLLETELIGKSVNIELNKVAFELISSIHLDFMGETYKIICEGYEDGKATLTYDINKNNLDTFFSYICQLFEEGATFEAKDWEFEYSKYELFTDDIQIFDEDDKNITDESLKNSLLNEIENLSDLDFYSEAEYSDEMTIHSVPKFYLDDMEGK